MRGVEFGPATFTLRVRGDRMAPQIRHGDYVYVDPDVPAEPGLFVALAHGEPGEATVWQLAEEGGLRVLRALDARCPDRALDADAEALIRGVVVFAGRKL